VRAWRWVLSNIAIFETLAIGQIGHGRIVAKAQGSSISKGKAGAEKQGQCFRAVHHSTCKAPDLMTDFFEEHWMSWERLSRLKNIGKYCDYLGFCMSIPCCSSGVFLKSR
jgi:hypothetical protein